MDLEKIRNYAQDCYDKSNCQYGEGNNYFVHINMVYDIIHAHKGIFIDDNESEENDFTITLAAALCHDILEDTKESYNDIAKICGKNVADVVLAVTDVPADNRLMKHLLTMHKTVKDYRAIILKMADILANATYSRLQGSSMYAKYVNEYAYRRPIFKMALEWHKHSVDMYFVQQLWDKLDEVHGYKQ